MWRPVTGRIKTVILVWLSRVIHLRANTKPTPSTEYLMQSALKHELHNVELTTLIYHISLLFQLHLGTSTASLKCCGREMPHPTPDPCVRSPTCSPSQNAAQPFHASHTQRSFYTHKWAGIPHPWPAQWPKGQARVWPPACVPKREVLCFMETSISLWNK